MRCTNIRQLVLGFFWCALPPLLWQGGGDTGALQASVCRRQMHCGQVIGFGLDPVIHPCNVKNKPKTFWKE